MKLVKQQLLFIIQPQPLILRMTRRLTHLGLQGLQTVQTKTQILVLILVLQTKLQEIQIQVTKLVLQTIQVLILIIRTQVEILIQVGLQIT